MRHLVGLALALLLAAAGACKPTAADEDGSERARGSFDVDGKTHQCSKLPAGANRALMKRELGALRQKGEEALARQYEGYLAHCPDRFAPTVGEGDSSVDCGSHAARGRAHWVDEVHKAKLALMEASKEKLELQKRHLAEKNSGVRFEDWFERHPKEWAEAEFKRRKLKKRQDLAEGVLKHCVFPAKVRPR